MSRKCSAHYVYNFDIYVKLIFFLRVFSSSDEKKKKKKQQNTFFGSFCTLKGFSLHMGLNFIWAISSHLSDLWFFRKTEVEIEMQGYKVWWVDKSSEEF